MNKSEKNSLKDLLSHDALLVVEKLKNSIDRESIYFNNLIEIEIQINNLKRKSILGIIKEEEKVITENKISLSILHIIDLIYSKKDVQKEKVIITSKYYWSTITPICICSLFAGIIFILIINNFEFIALTFFLLFVVLIYFFGKKAAINFLNHRKVKKRAKKYYENLILFPDRIKILMEGDSWFNFPMKQDVSDHLAEYFNVYCLAEAGDDIRGILRDGNFKKVFEIEKPQIVLFNAGGNELCEMHFNKIIKSKYDGDDFFTPYLSIVLEDLMHYFRETIEELTVESTNIIINGYDYITYKNGAMYKVLKKRGFPDPDAVKIKLIDEYNLRLKELASDYENVFYLDLRNTLNRKEEWFDEMHPNESGFLRISRKYNSKIKEIVGNDVSSSRK